MFHGRHVTWARAGLSSHAMHRCGVQSAIAQMLHHACAAMQMHHLSTVRFLAAPPTTAAHACQRDPRVCRRVGLPYPGCDAPAWLLLALDARREGSTRGEERLVGWEEGGLCERSTRVGLEGVDLNALSLANLRVSGCVGTGSHRLSHASRSAPGTRSAEGPVLVFALSFSPPPPRAPSLEGVLKRRSCRCQPSHGQR